VRPTQWMVASWVEEESTKIVSQIGDHDKWIQGKRGRLKKPSVCAALAESLTAMLGLI
jgi:hypothetical protein